MEHVEKALAVASRTAQTHLRLRPGLEPAATIPVVQVQQLLRTAAAIPVAHADGRSPEHSATASGMLAGRL